MTDAQLGAAISRLGDDLAWPPTADVAPAVVARLRARASEPSVRTPRLRLASRRRTVLVIAAALLALAGAALAARLVIELGAVTVQVVPGRGGPSALPSTETSAGDLGREIGLAQASRVAGFPLVLPADLGPPDRAWVDEAVVAFEPSTLARRIVTAWSPSDDLPRIPGTDIGALLMQFEGDEEVAFKQVFSETNRFGTTMVGDRKAFWTSGEHRLVLISGETSQALLVTGNVLIWQEGAFTFRLETSLPKEDAVAIAESMTSVDPD